MTMCGFDSHAGSLWFVVLPYKQTRSSRSPFVRIGTTMRFAVHALEAYGEYYYQLDGWETSTLPLGPEVPVLLRISRAKKSH